MFKNIDLEFDQMEGGIWLMTSFTMVLEKNEFVTH